MCLSKKYYFLLYLENYLCVVFNLFTTVYEKCNTQTEWYEQHQIWDMCRPAYHQKLITFPDRWHTHRPNSDISCVTSIVSVMPCSISAELPNKVEM